MSAKINHYTSKNQSSQEMLEGFSHILTALKSLKTKIFVTIFILVLYRLGTYVPLPFVSKAFYVDILTGDIQQKGLIGMVNAISGGALGRYSFFSLNVMPYIVSSIVVQLFFASFTEKSRSAVSSKISLYTKGLTVVFAFVQGCILAFTMIRSEAHSFLYLSGYWMFWKYFLIVLTLMTGSLSLIWLGELITAHGIGNGISILIFTGIVSELPKAIYSTLEMGRIGAYSGVFVLLIFLLFALLMAFIVFVERSNRNISVHYHKRAVGQKLYARQSSHIPIKINISGVIPAIFANTLILIPASLMGLYSRSGGIVFEVLRRLYSGNVLYYLLYCFLIIFFTFFYTFIVFNPDDIANNLKKGGGVIAGRRPGSHTAEYIKYVVSRITCLGACYITFVCVAVDIFRVRYSIPFALGGTSVLIAVSVVHDLVNQIRLHVFRHRYDSVIKRVGLR